MKFFKRLLGDETLSLTFVGAVLVLANSSSPIDNSYLLTFFGVAVLRLLRLLSKIVLRRGQSSMLMRSKKLSRTFALRCFIVFLLDSVRRIIRRRQTASWQL